MKLVRLPTSTVGAPFNSTWSNDSNMHLWGYIYGPESNVTVSYMKVTGAVLGNNVTIIGTDVSTRIDAFNLSTKDCTPLSKCLDGTVTPVTWRQLR